MASQKLTTTKASARSLASGARPNTIGLGQRELGELLDRFETPGNATGATGRNFVRWPFRHTSIAVQIFQPGGAASEITVACRNISRTGMAILHSAYMHTGTKCLIHLPHPSRGTVPVVAWVTRCVHKSGVVHEIGIRFDAPVEVQELLRPDPFSDWFSLEKVAPQDLAGSIVYADHSEIDRHIVRHFLRETHIAFKQASSGAEAMACVDDSTDLVLIDYHLGDTTGHEVAARFRGAGRTMPIILVTCDTKVGASCGAAHIDAFLAKPLSQEILLRALGEFLIVRRTSNRVADPAVGSAAADSQLAAGILAALSQYADRVDDCIGQQDAVSARTVCLQIAGTAGSGGFQEVKDLAFKAADSLSRHTGLTESLCWLNAVTAACRGAGRTLNTPQPNPAAAA